MQRNSTIIWGRKPKTAPMPPIMPSRTNEESQAGELAAVSQPSTVGGMISPNRTSLTQSVIMVPTVEMEMK